MRAPRAEPKPTPFPLLVALSALKDFEVEERKPRLIGLNAGFRVLDEGDGVGVESEEVNEVAAAICDFLADYTAGYTDAK